MVVVIKTLIFDLETTGLFTGFSRVLMYSAKWHLPDGSGEMTTLRADDPRFFNKKDVVDDSRLVAAIIKHLETADIIVGHNSLAFDAAFLRGRAIKHGLQPMKPMFHIDTYQLVKGNLRTSGKLANLSGFLHLPTPKMDVPPEVWARAHAFDKKSMDILQERCESDVDLTEALLVRLKPLLKSIPRRG